MIRFNLVLLSILVVCALATVTAQYTSRKLFVELQHEQTLARQMDIEWGQLQLEQSTWAMHARIEKIATGRLNMRVPGHAQTRIVPLVKNAAGPKS
jgi:cell division protein FtsL